MEKKNVCDVKAMMHLWLNDQAKKPFEFKIYNVTMLEKGRLLWKSEKLWKGFNIIVYCIIQLIYTHLPVICFFTYLLRFCFFLS